MLPEQSEVKQIDHAQATPPGFVFVCWSDPAGSRPDLDPAGSILRGQLNHSMIGKNYVSAIADEQIAIDLHARISQTRDFFEKGDRVEHYAIPNYATAAL